MPEKPAFVNRAERRKRTRKAIVEATMALLARGEHPSVGEIADAAGVSRRTVYMHFPTLEQLMIDAMLGSLSETAVDSALHSPPADDASARVESLAKMMTQMSSETLPMGRRLLRLTIEDAKPTSRGYRRIEWIEGALEPLRGRLNPAQFERLVSALSMVLGWEALIVLNDIRGVSENEGESVIVWAARALVKAALEESQYNPGTTATGGMQ